MVKKNILKKLDSLILKNQSEIIHQSLQKKQLKNLNTNLQFFKENSIEIYNDYCDYQATKYVFGYDSYGHSNIYDNTNHSYLYAKNHQEVSLEQVSEFNNHPNQVGITLEVPINSSNIFKEPLFIKKFYDDLAAQTLNVKFDEPVKTIGFMIVIGIGLGEHIKLIIEKYDIKHLILIESEPDIFFSSLHTMDWPKITKPFSQLGHSLNLFIDKPPETILNNIAKLYIEKGQLHAAKTYFFVHSCTEKSVQTISFLQKYFANTLNTQGFIEDELISISHSLNNLNMQIPIVNKILKSKLPQCLICGNGPSLDDSIPFIDQIQDKYLIVSCGSTIGTLLKADIIPDIHIELERTFMTTESLLSMNIPSNVLQQTLFIGFNTVPPETFALFKNKIMVLKDLDGGSEAINARLQEYLPLLSYCNPTVTNAGLSVILSLGFKNIFLAGIDLGSRDPMIHHALSSEYYNEENQPFQTYETIGHDIQIQGNLRDKVYTNQELLQSNINIAELITRYPDCHVSNLSDGAMIKNTETIIHQQLMDTPCNDIEKGKIIQKIISEATLPIDIMYKTNAKQAITLLKPTLDLLHQLSIHSLPRIQDTNSLYNHLFELINVVIQFSDNNSICKSTTAGSLNKFFLYIYLHAFHTKGKLDNSLQFSLGIFKKFILYCINLLEKNILTTHSELLQSRRESLDEN